MIGIFKWIDPLTRLVDVTIGQTTEKREVRDAVLVDNTSYITLSGWGDLIKSIQEEFTAYKITDVSLRDFMGPKISTTGRTVFTPQTEMQPFTDWPRIYLQKLKKSNKQLPQIIQLPNILNLNMTTYPLCTNAKCLKKFTPIPGDLTVECPGVNYKRKMLLSKCHCGLTCAIEVEHEPKPLDLTIFPENKFFEEDIIQKYKDNLFLLETKILMMNNVDFHYNTKKVLLK